MRGDFDQDVVANGLRLWPDADCGTVEKKAPLGTAMFSKIGYCPIGRKWQINDEKTF